MLFSAPFVVTYAFPLCMDLESRAFALAVISPPQWNCWKDSLCNMSFYQTESVSRPNIAFSWCWGITKGSISASWVLGVLSRQGERDRRDICEHSGRRSTFSNPHLSRQNIKKWLGTSQLTVFCFVTHGLDCIILFKILAGFICIFGIDELAQLLGVETYWRRCAFSINYT